ncbi:MAG: hypothetical protein AAF587_37740 [Bacteroidota bacterium]
MKDWTEFGYEILKESIVILVLGVVVAYLLEKFKNKITLVREVNHARVDKISDCWEEHSELEYQLFEVHEDLLALEGTHISEELKEKCDKLMDQREVVRKTMAKHKFWLNQDVYKESQHYLEIIDSYKVALCNGNKVECERLKEDIDKITFNVDSLIKLLLKKL